MKVMQTYNATSNESLIPPQAHIAPPTILPSPPVVMYTFTHPITIPSDSDIEDAFSSTHSPNYISASPNYFPASSGNTSLDPSEDLSKYLLASLAISLFYDDPYMKVMQTYNATSNESLIPPQAHIAPPTILPSPPVISALELIIEDIQVHHRSDKKSLLEKIRELKNHKGGPPGY
nr:hypothetical protein [Tanacetum cinerariifolium]